MKESELCPPGPCVIELIERNSRVHQFISKHSAIDVREDRIPILSFLVGFQFIYYGLSDHSVTESELCPPGPCVNELIERNSRVHQFISKHSAIDVREDRIPILSFLVGFQFISYGLSVHFKTESELCPPDPHVNELIERNSGVNQFISKHCPCVIELIERNSRVHQFISKHSAIDVREDRIPILSFLVGFQYISYGLSDHSVTESELCPPGPCVNELIERNSRVHQFISKHSAIDVREDRIPILSFLVGFQYISYGLSDHSVTESELCPPGSCVKELIGILHVLIRIKKSPGTRPGLKHL